MKKSTIEKINKKKVSSANFTKVKFAYEHGKNAVNVRYIPNLVMAFLPAKLIFYFLLI